VREIESAFDNVVFLYGYISEKDVFEVSLQRAERGRADRMGLAGEWRGEERRGITNDAQRS
jgi:hypothetical protein